MRLTLILKAGIIGFIFLKPGIASAQKHDSTYWNSWAKLYKIIDASFTNRTDTSIIEQTAIVQFGLTEGMVDTFYIWSTYDKQISNWMVPFFKPAIGKCFQGYKRFKYVIVPIRIVDYRIHNEGDEVSDDHNFIFEFIGAFKHSISERVTITQGILLEPPWPAIK